MAAARPNSELPDGKGPSGSAPPYLWAFQASVLVPQKASCRPEVSAARVASTRPLPESSGEPAPR